MSRSGKTKAPVVADRGPTGKRDPAARRGASTALAVLAVCLVAAIAYLPAMTAPFVFDDVPSIVDNVSIRQAWPPFDALRPPKRSAFAGRPVVNYSFAVNGAVARLAGWPALVDGTSPDAVLPYHLGNLLLHLCSGALVFGIVRRTLVKQRYSERWAASAFPVALGVTMVWLVHPIQTEAVLYTTQRTELLVGACYLAALYAWIRAWDASGSRAAIAWRIGAVLACLVGMGSKEVMVTAPLVIVLYDRAFRVDSWRALAGRRDGRVWWYGLLAATGIWRVALSAGTSRNGTAGFATGIHWYEYLYSQGWAIPRYLRLMVWPNDLVIDYGVRPLHEAWAALGLVALGVCVAAVLVAWRRADRWGWCAFLGSWFFLILAPSSSVVPITTEIAAERRVYLPLLAVVMLTAIGGDALWTRLRRATPRAERPGHPVAVLMAAASAFLLVATFERGRTYRDPEALWGDAVAKVPENPRALEALGVLMANESPPRLSDADSLFARAGALDSSSVSPLYERALVALAEHRGADARAMLEQVVRRQPDYPNAAGVLGQLVDQSGRPDLAVPLLRQAVAAQPSAQLDHELGVAYLGLGRTDDALGALRTAVALDSSPPSELSFLGSVLAESGHPAEAIAALERALAMEPQNLRHAARLAVAYAAAGRSADARQMANAVVERSAGNPSVLPLAARALMMTNDAAGAARVLALADSLAPNTPDVLLALGDARAALGDRASAAQLYRRALSLRPDDSQAKAKLGKLAGPTDAGRGPPHA